jgi:hypothetical protein
MASSLIDGLDHLHDNGVSDDTLKAVITELLNTIKLKDATDIKPLILMKDNLDNGNGFIYPVVLDHEGCCFDMGGLEFLVLDAEERTYYWDDALDEYLDEFVRGSDSKYFNREKWKDDERKGNDAGSMLAGYDSIETVYGSKVYGYYYIYRNH